MFYRYDIVFIIIEGQEKYIVRRSDLLGRKKYYNRYGVTKWWKFNNTLFQEFLRVGSFTKKIAVIDFENFTGINENRLKIYKG